LLAVLTLPNAECSRAIALPDGTGADLMMQLRATSTVPGIAISGFGDNGDIERSLRAGFSKHLIQTRQA